ncbi:hypothetical protein ACLBOM_36510 [Escherichia coli]
MESMLPKVDGSSADWQDKAKPMLYGLGVQPALQVQTENLRLSLTMLHKHLPLKEMGGPLHRGQNRTAGTRKELTHWRTTCQRWPAFRWTWSAVRANGIRASFHQHGFLIQQFSKMLAMFNDVIYTLRKRRR